MARRSLVDAATLLIQPLGSRSYRCPPPITHSQCHLQLYVTGYGSEASKRRWPMWHVWGDESPWVTLHLPSPSLKPHLPIPHHHPLPPTLIYRCCCPSPDLAAIHHPVACPQCRLWLQVTNYGSETGKWQRRPRRCMQEYGSPWVAPRLPPPPPEPHLPNSPSSSTTTNTCLPAPLPSGSSRLGPNTIIVYHSSSTPSTDPRWESNGSGQGEQAPCDMPMLAWSECGLMCHRVVPSLVGGCPCRPHTVR